MPRPPRHRVRRRGRGHRGDAGLTGRAQTGRASLPQLRLLSAAQERRRRSPELSSSPPVIRTADHPTKPGPRRNGRPVLSHPPEIELARRTESAVWSISHRACRAPTLACLWHSVTRPGGLSWVSANRWDRNWPSPPVPARPGGAPMTTAAPSSALAAIQPAFTDPERLALAGFLAGYRGLTHEAYALDLRRFTS